MFKREATEEMQVSAFERDRSYTLACDSCSCAYEFTHSFKPEGDGTVLEIWMIDGRPSSRPDPFNRRTPADPRRWSPRTSAAAALAPTYRPPRLLGDPEPRSGPALQPPDSRNNRN